MDPGDPRFVDAPFPPESLVRRDPSFDFVPSSVSRSFARGDGRGLCRGSTRARYRYVVHDCRPDHRDRFRKPSAPIADLVAAGGKVVYYWPEQVPLEEAQLILLAVPLT